MIISGTLQPAKGFTVGEEKKIGEKLLYAVRSSFPILDDPDLHQYINKIGHEVLDVAGIQFFEYHFYVVESSQFNAFAAPSGLIFFYSKLIESMNSEDELVSVMAHEVGHVVRRHLASRMKKGKMINFASMGAALAAIALGGGAAAQGLLAGSLAAGQSAQLHFSRQDEIEADLMAYQWMQAMHRDTIGQKKMLRTMRRITRYRTGQIPQYLLTHPDPEARLDYVESLIAADKEYRVEIEDSQNFSFMRFKYRIMSLTHRSSTARAFMASELSDSRSSDFEKTMARYGLAQIDRRINNYEQSLARLDEVIAEFPDKPVLLVDKAVVLADKGDYRQARMLLEQVMRTEPHNSYVLFNLAKVLANIGESDQAVELFKQVAYDIPEFSDVYFEIGKILSDQGKDVEARYYLGKFNLYEGQLKLASANFKQVASKTEEQSEIGKDSREMLELIERLKDK
ncbi:MAG: beta-barrel assembly-enhancing protease [Desulfocapsaceae bacterium]